MSAERLVEFYAYETVGAAITHAAPVMEVEHDGLTVRMSKDTYDRLVAEDDGEKRWEMFKALLAEELVEGGDISSLGKQVSTDLPHSFTNPQSDVTVYYHRDRGEEMNRNDFDSFEEAMSEKENEYNYLFQDGAWYLHGKLLTQEMCK
jgi:hypothetical protein